MHSYAVVFLLLLTAIDTTYAEASINCSNLTSVCLNTPITLTCKTSITSGVKWESKLFEELQFYQDEADNNNDIGIEKKSNDTNFVITVLRIGYGYVLTSLTFNFNCSYEGYLVVCKDQADGNVDNCTISYEYIRSPLAPSYLNLSKTSTTISLNWSLNENIKVEHLSLSIEPPPSKGNCERGNCNMNGVRNEFTATGLQSNTTYTVFLKVENCAGYSITSQTVTTNASNDALKPPTELCACVISQTNTTNITVEMHWNCPESDTNHEMKINYYLIKVFDKNGKLMHLQYKNSNSCGGKKRHIVELPNNDSIFTFQVSAMSRTEESQPDSKEINFTSAYLLTIERANVSTSNNTVQCLCCVGDVRILSIHNNAKCIIKLDKGLFEGNNSFVGERCVHVIIHVNNSIYINNYKNANISYLAYFYYDPNKCYETRGTTYNTKADKALLMTPASLLYILIGFIINTIV